MSDRPMRELLRDSANNLYAMADHGGNPKHVAEMEMQAAALRALANRIDAEIRDVTDDNDGAVRAFMIARLDAALDQPCPHGHRYEDCCWEGTPPAPVPTVCARCRSPFGPMCDHGLCPQCVAADPCRTLLPATPGEPKP